MRHLFRHSKKSSKNSKPTNNMEASMDEAQFSIAIEKDLNKNLENIKSMLGNPSDLIVREITIVSSKNKCAILYISGLTNSDLVNNNILKAVQSSNIQSSTTQRINGEVNQESNSQSYSTNESGTNQSNTPLIDLINQEVISITSSKKVTTLDDVSLAILSGNTVFILDGENTILVMDTAGGEKRSIQEPQSEAVIRGPRTGFVESIETNISLIRKDLKDPNLRFDVHEIGRRSKQKLAVCYIAGIVNQDILDEVNRRLKTIDVDFAPDSGLVEQWIEDSFLSPLPQILDTERPDRLMYNILQGKIGILVDGSPFALITPIVFGEALLSIEDYNERWLSGTALRLLRFIALLFAVFLPAIYVALISYHPGLIPTQLAFSIAASRENVPFPAIVEILLMAVVFELLQEAGIRLPKAIGSTVGIVGGIVIGEVAVSAGLVGPAAVIVTSLTGIASFTIPNYSMVIGVRIIRFAFLIGASFLGLYGVVLIFIMIAIHVVNLKSMGIPYSAPLAPYFFGSLKNIIIRAPITTLVKRQPFLKPEDIKKIDDGGHSSK